MVNEVLSHCLTGLKSLNNFVRDLRIDRIETLVNVFLKLQSEIGDIKGFESELVLY